MAETLVERLERAQGESCGCTDLGVFEDAAARIRALEAALKGIIADFDDYPTHDRPLLALLSAGRAALEQGQ